MKGLPGLMRPVHGQELAGYVVLGLAGSLGAGGFHWALGVPGGRVAVAVVTCIGGAVVIALQRRLWPAKGGRAAPPRGRRPVWGVEL